MKVTSVPSCIPNWYDPSVPGYKRPASFVGARFRFKIKVGTDPARELKEARARYEKEYPGALIHVVSEFEGAPVNEIEAKGGDEELLRSYFDANPPAEGTVDEAVAYLKPLVGGRFGVEPLTFLECEANETLCFEHARWKLDRKGLTLVTGVNKDWADEISNGAGKSSFVSLPFLPLFGRTFKDQVDDGWARQKTKKTASCAGRYKLNDGRELRVWRSRRPQAVRAWVDGREVSMGSKTDTNRMLERLTNLTWDVLTNSVYVSQHEVGSVFGTEKERKELFSRLLGLERFLDGQKKVNEAVKKARRFLEEVESALESVESAMREAGAGVEEVAEALKGAPAVDAKDLKAKENRIGELEALVRQREKLIADLTVEMEANQKQFEGFLFEGIEAETQIKVIGEQIKTAQGVTGRCATCGSRVGEDALEKYVLELERKRAPHEKVLERSERQQQANRNVRSTMIDGVRAARSDVDKFRRELTDVGRSVTSLKAALDARSRLEAMLASKKKRTAELEKEKRVHERAAKAERAEIAFLESCSRAMSRDGIPAHLVALVTPKLNAAAARYSEVFCNGEIGVSFSASAGDVDLEVTNLHGGLSKKDQSEGEMRLAGYVVVFAFRDVLVPHNLLVLDEPGAGLDPANAEAFARALNKVVDRFQHVVVISHNERIVGALEPTYQIEIVKENGTSKAREL